MINVCWADKIQGSHSGTDSALKGFMAKDKIYYFMILVLRNKPKNLATPALNV